MATILRSLVISFLHFVVRGVIHGYVGITGEELFIDGLELKCEQAEPKQGQKKAQCAHRWFLSDWLDGWPLLLKEPVIDLTICARVVKREIKYFIF
jgi:hypothetical protein